MSHPTSQRREIRGELVCTSALHVGGWDPSALADLAIARDGQGRPIIAGTSLAGVMRGYLLSQEKYRDYVDQIFGHIKPGTQEGSASWLRVDDAQVITPECTPRPILRTSVGIDRHSGSAAAKFLYTREVLPPGTRFTFRMVADTPISPTSPPDGWAALIRDGVDELIQALQSGWLSLGAGTSRGLGRVELREANERQADLNTRAGLCDWLRGVDVKPLPAVESPSLAPGQLKIEIKWHPISPVLSRDALDGQTVQTFPLTEVTHDGQLRLLLPGSSIKGVLRAHCERIVRTLRPPPAPVRSFEQLLAAPPVGVDALFGVAPQPGADGTAAEADPGWRGALTVADCHSKNGFSEKNWATITGLTPARTSDHGPGNAKSQRDESNVYRAEARKNLEGQLAKLNKEFAVDLSVSDHVAIDRWTGGAADHRLFSVLDPAANTKWQPIQLTLDVERLTRAAASGKGQPKKGRAHAELALPLLLLVLRDLRDGWLSLGFGGTRGRGQIEIDKISFNGIGLPEPWKSLIDQNLDDTFLENPPPKVVEAMAHWKAFFPEEAS